MEQYLIYLRKSRSDLEAEAHGEGETLSRHEHTLLELAKRQHLNVTDIYREVVSGDTIAARPMMQRVLSEVEQGVWSGVLVMEVERLARIGFEMAKKRRGKLCSVDKANVLDTSRLWRAVAARVAGDYPQVEVNYMYVDNAAMRMIQEPKFFDVMVTENTFGDILTDEGSCISGSMGLLPSASTGESTPVFEPIHGSWPQAKGLNIANPLAQILSVAMLFEYFDLKEEGALIREAVDASLDANVRTPEIQVEGGAKYGTKEVGSWIVNYIREK